jgi:hypothetical protein
MLEITISLYTYKQRVSLLELLLNEPKADYKAFEPTSSYLMIKTQKIRAEFINFIVQRIQSSFNHSYS